MSDVYEAPEAEESDIPENYDEPEAEGVEQEGEEEAEASAEPAKDWRKIAEDKQGQAAKERSKRRAAEQRAAELAERISKLEAAANGKSDPLQSLVQSLRDDDEDPIGDLSSVKALAKQLIAEREEEVQREAQNANQRRYIASLNEAMNDAETDFRAENPDYDDAAKHLREALAEEFQDEGYTGAQLQQKLAETLYGIVGNALKAGNDPAAVVYRRAKRYGFTSATVDAAQKKLQTLAKTSRASGAVPSGGVKGQLSPQSVASLKGADFDKAFARLREQQRH